MRFASEPNIFSASIAADAIGLVVVELHSLARRAAPAVFGLIRALTAVTLPYEASHRGGDAAHTGRRVGFFETLSRVFRLTETLGFQPFEFLAHGSFHNRSEVYARHERGEPLDFVTKLGARRELNFITRGGQRLDDRQLLRCFRSRSWRRGLTILSDAVWTGSV